jgi:integrase/recombinase XerD
MEKGKIKDLEQQQLTKRTPNSGSYYDQVFDRKVDLITAGLRPYHARTLRNEKYVSRHNTMIICDYLFATNIEVNPSPNYKRTNIVLLVQFCKFHNQKPFNDITREDILSFLDNLRKPESVDPMHKWIGTYNQYNTNLTCFFKWLYSPDNARGKRPKPSIVQNIPRLTRKEKSIYKPADLWTNEEDLLFLKYCPSSRIRCYHAVERDTGCRPKEILGLRIKDIVFKNVNNGTGQRQYAEITVNGKTWTRSLPLIDSLPYIKDYLNSDHPQSGNPNAMFICGEGRSLGKRMDSQVLYYIYLKYKNEVFPRLLDNPNVLPEDKQMIKELLKKPWNPYVVGRHATLTQKSRILKEATLRVFSGWTADSDMPRRYTHLFENAACEDILEAYGLLDKGIQLQQQLRSKQCPNCNEPNKPDSRFCAKCKMILSYDSYNEVLQDQERKESEVQSLMEKQENDLKLLREDMNKQFSQVMEIIRENPKLANVKPEALTKKVDVNALYF